MEQTYCLFAQLQWISWGMASSTSIPTLDGQDTYSILLEKASVKNNLVFRIFITMNA